MCEFDSLRNCNVCVAYRYELLAAFQPGNNAICVAGGAKIIAFGACLGAITIICCGLACTN